MTAAKTKKEKILDAAIKLFVEHGFHATSMTDLAKTADVTYALIYHHFQDKATLWNTVKEKIFSDHAEETDLSHYKGASLKQILEGFVAARAKLYNDRNFTRILSWQYLENEEEKSGPAFLAFNAWLRLFGELQKAGKIRASLNTEQLLVWMMGSVGYGIMSIKRRNEEKAAASKVKSYLKMLIQEFEKVLKPE